MLSSTTQGRKGDGENLTLTPLPLPSLLPVEAIKTPASPCCHVTPPRGRLWSKPPKGAREVLASPRTSKDTAAALLPPFPALECPISTQYPQPVTRPRLGSQLFHKSAMCVCQQVTFFPRLCNQTPLGSNPSSATFELSCHLSEPRFPHF